MSVESLICQEVYEGLRFDCVSPNELYCEVVDFGGPFSISTYGFWVLEDVVKREARGYGDLVRLEIVLQFSGGHDDCICYLLHFCIELFWTIKGFGYKVHWQLFLLVLFLLFSY